MKTIFLNILSFLIKIKQNKPSHHF